MADDGRRLPRWVYVIAVVVGSFAGNMLDMMWIGGGYTMTKVVALAAPILLWALFGRARPA
ncbi:MAG: hypothetical protein WBA25_12350 [Jannaschia sp.]